MVTQEDLRFIHCFRAVAFGDDEAQRAVKATLAMDPGRAAGRVAHWAIDRSVELLKRFGRRGLSEPRGIVPSAQELKLAEILKALQAYDRPAAAAAALWLVPQKQVAALLDHMAPLTAFYPAAETGRRAAQA